MLRGWLLVLLVHPGFRGCGDRSLRKDDVPLPVTTDARCVADTECGAGTCGDWRCLAGICREVAVSVDRDADGEAPLPCGQDCDDTDPLVTGRAGDRCDGADNDCDGSVDEEGGTDQTIVTTGVLDPESLVVAWGDAFAITELTSGALFLRPVWLDGRVGAPSELLRLQVGGALVQVEAATSPLDGSVFFSARTDVGAILFTIARPRDDGSAEIVDGPAVVPIEGQITDFVLVEHAEGWLVGLDAIQPEGTARALLDTVTSGVVARWLLDEDASPPPLAVASTGSRSVITVADGVSFHAGGTAELARAPQPLAARPLASGNDTVTVAYEGASGLELGVLHPSAEIRVSPVRTASMTDDARILRLGNGQLLVTGRDPLTRAVSAWLVAADLSVVERGPIELAGYETVEVSAAATERALGVLGAGVSGGSLRLYLDCE